MTLKTTESAIFLFLQLKLFSLFSSCESDFGKSNCIYTQWRRSTEHTLAFLLSPYE